MDLEIAWLFLIGSWWIWLAYAILALGGWYGYWRLFARREYREINGRLCVRHGVGKWVDLEEHMREYHPAEYAILKKQGKK